MIKVKDIRTFLSNSLGAHFPETELRAFHRLIVDHFCGYSPAQTLLYAEEELEENIVVSIKGCITQLSDGRPIQYILGYAWFYGHQFIVKSGILIPRPETEELVEWILKESTQANDILDVGTGSGCIAISLALRSQAQITAIDLSTEALAQAQENAQHLKAEVKFILTDLFDVHQIGLLGTFDLIVSNPPYVLDSDKKNMEIHILDHEPHEAMFVPDHDALKYYEALAELAFQKLNPGGELYLEIHEEKGIQVVQMLELKGFKSIVLKKDFQGKDRMVKAICIS